MAYSYNLTTPRGKVRFLVPDNDSASYELTDEEIDYLLGQSGNDEKLAAVKACKWLARKYAKTPTFSADGLSVSGNARAETYAKRAAELEAELGGVSSVTLEKQDVFHDNVGVNTEYERRIVYVRL
jgi:hypothetical protein